jgi:hypothetical protein
MHTNALLVAATTLLVATSACAGGSSSHPASTLAQAVHQARADGFVDPMHGPDESWRCAPHQVDIGPARTTGRYAGYVRPVYSIEFGDRRAPARADKTARIGMIIAVFTSARFAAMCATAEIETERSFTSHGKLVPYKVVSPTTIEHGMRRAGAPGSPPGETGQFDTYLADGPVFAMGMAYNLRDSKIVQDDLARLAHELAA